MGFEHIKNVIRPLKECEMKFDNNGNKTMKEIYNIP